VSEYEGMSAVARANKWAETPPQTVGPFHSIGLRQPDWALVVPLGTPGAFWLRGSLRDGAGEPVPDGVIETWQADPDGRFDHPDDPRGAAVSAVPGFRGFGRTETLDGEWAVYLVKPGRLPDGDGGLQAPHVDLSVFARGLLDRVVTRVYFDDEDAANAEDPVLRGLDPDRRATLVATSVEDGYRLEIVLQGDRETVFFRV
jgi:protocatechuate 3,4-dioxygenase alpha subunit